MAILRRYICSKHGEFDAWEDSFPRCPAQKCRCKPRQMVSAPAVHTSGRTSGIDSTLKNLASDFKMTNLSSAREGESQAAHHSHAEPKPGSGVMWGDAGGMKLDSIVKGGQFRSVRGEQVGVKPTELGVKRGPAVASYMKDHENLKLDK